MSSRLRVWAGSWRVATRLARRDLRAHRVRSALVITMILGPIALMVFAMGVLATSEVSAAEAPNTVLGSAQATISYVGDVRITQSPDASVLEMCDNVSISSLSFSMAWQSDDPLMGDPACPRATPIPGLDVNPAQPRSPQDAVAPLSALVGAPIVGVYRQQLPLGADVNYRIIEVLYADGANDIFRGMVDLRNGRWPQSRREAVVTEAGIAAGLPENGQLTSKLLSARLGTDTVTIVGVARADKSAATTPELILPPEVITHPTTTSSAVRNAQEHDQSVDNLMIAYLMGGDNPLTWPQVKRLNEYGLLVLSRQVIADPPPAAEVPITARQVDSESWGSSAYSQMPWLAIPLLVVACFITGPAFTVMAAGQRRRLAIVAANGADERQLRRTMTAEATILGLIAALGGIALGVAAVFTLTAWPRLARLLSGQGMGPLDIPTMPVLATAAVGIIAAIIAALIPTRGLSSADIASVLAGSEVNPPPGASRPLIALGLLALGMVANVAAWVIPPWWRGDSEPGVSIPTVLCLVVALATCAAGTLLLVSCLLAWVGRISYRLPLPLRMAIRESSRARGRATSTVAAVMAGGILLSALALPLASSEDFRRARYAGTAPLGQVTLNSVAAGQAANITATVDATMPGLRVRVLSTLDELRDPTASTQTHLIIPTIGWVVPGCDAKGQTQWESIVPPCVFAPRANALNSQLASATLADATGLFGLDEHARDVLEAGGVVVLTDDHPLIDDAGKAHLITGETAVANESNATSWVSAPTITELPAVRVPGREFALGWGPVTAVITSQTAAHLGLAASESTLIVGPVDDRQAGHLASAATLPPGGGVSDAQAARLDRITGASLPSTVERGYSSQLASELAVLVACVGVLTIIATLTATILALGESRRDVATMTALGARRRTLHGYAGALAAWTSGIGIFAGLLIGSVAGIPLSLSVTSTGGEVGGYYGLDSRDPMSFIGEQLHTLTSGHLAVPWPVLLGALVVVPLLAALIAATLVARGGAPARRMD